LCDGEPRRRRSSTRARRYAATSNAICRSPAAAAPLAPEQLEQLTGFYQSITRVSRCLRHRQHLLLANRARQGRRTRVQRHEAIHIGNNLFQKTDKAVPNIGLRARWRRRADVHARPARPQSAASELVAKRLWRRLVSRARTVRALHVESGFRARSSVAMTDRGGLTISCCLLGSFQPLSSRDSRSSASRAQTSPRSQAGPLGWALYGATLATPVLGVLRCSRRCKGAPNASIIVRWIAWLSSIATLAFAATSGRTAGSESSCGSEHASVRTAPRRPGQSAPSSAAGTRRP